MSLIDDVKIICDRLAPRGWEALLRQITNNALNISQPTSAGLKRVLARSIANIDRTGGFKDFHPRANKGIVDGHPEQSLLYHALASPFVHPTADGLPSNDPDDYPTLEELDTVENYIYSLVANRTDLDDTEVVVFAYQYRVASRSPHQNFADFAYSRTGVARVGTTQANYDSSRRSFWAISPDGTDALPVLPARYGAFLARKAKPGAAGSVQGGHRGINDEDFWFPVHKLFAGDECLSGQTIGLDFLEYHRNEKIRKAHERPLINGGLPLPAGFDINKFPFVRDSINGGDLASLNRMGSSVLVMPTPGNTLVRTVSQQNTVTNTDQILHFVVPSSPRFESSLEIPRSGAARLAPEYVNIRQQIDPTQPVTQNPIDLSSTLNRRDFSNAMRNGGYPAAHFTDDSCDGSVEAIVTGMRRSRNSFPAFSLITAPDYFPLADQFELDQGHSIRRVSPLSKGRLPVNPTLPRPSNLSLTSFNHSEKSVTAIVGKSAFGPIVSANNSPNRMVSYLPDGASDIFAPGWDTSRSRDGEGPFLTNYGLGSPFPEDAKLCAALSSFWPAVAPDNGRTFGNEKNYKNQLPMLDKELGFHPNHPRVLSGEVATFIGWDGEFGPFFETVQNRLHVNFVAIERSDYVSHALAGRIRVSLTALVQSEELIARNNALLACMRIPRGHIFNDACLVVFRKIDDWTTFGAGRPELTGPGYLLEFAELFDSRQPTTEFNRVRKRVRRKHICQFGTNGVAHKNGNRPFRFHPQ